MEGEQDAVLGGRESACGSNERGRRRAVQFGLLLISACPAREPVLCLTAAENATTGRQSSERR